LSHMPKSIRWQRILQNGKQGDSARSNLVPHLAQRNIAVDAGAV